MTLWSRKENIAIATEHSHLLVFGDPIFLNNAIFTDLESFLAKSITSDFRLYTLFPSSGRFRWLVPVYQYNYPRSSADSSRSAFTGSQNYSFCYRGVKICIYANIFRCTAFDCELYFKNFLTWKFSGEEFFRRLTTSQSAVIREEATFSK